MAKVFSLTGNLVAIDIGTTKICVLVANKIDKNNIEILGIGTSPSDGLKKGIVVDIGKTISSIKAAVKEAEIMSGIKIESAYIGIAGSHIKSFNSKGMISIKKGEVKERDIKEVISVAKAIQIPEGQQILHVLPQYFILDSKDKIINPLGMYAIRLEAKVHIVTGAAASVQNLIKCCESAGIEVQDIILEQLASAEAVLSKDERELGAGILDIGGGTSDFAIYKNNSIRYTMVLPVAGSHFTNDAAAVLRTTLKDAEKIKKELGLNEKIFEINSIDGCSKKRIKSEDLNYILKLRAEELFSLVYKEIVNNNLESFISSGLALTGGGSLLHGISKIAEKIFSVPVRIGQPNLENNMPELLNNPSYSTAYGLILKSAENKDFAALDESSVMSRIVSRMKSWVYDFF